MGWYHSHPGYDRKNQEMFENADEDRRAVAVVVDPVLSVRGKVVIGAFRDIPDSLILKEKRVEDPREKTSFIGHKCNPSPTTMVRGLNEGFYQLLIELKMNESELPMLPGHPDFQFFCK